MRYIHVLTASCIMAVPLVAIAVLHAMPMFNLAETTTSAQAIDQPVTPSSAKGSSKSPESTNDVGATPETAVPVPQDSTDPAVGRLTNGQDDFIYVHNNSDKTQQYLILRMKDVPESLTDRGAVRLEVGEIRYRVEGEPFYETFQDPNEPQFHDAEGNVKPNGNVAINGARSQRDSQTGEIRIYFPAEWPHCTKIRLEVTLQERTHYDSRSSGYPWTNGSTLQDMNFYVARRRHGVPQDPAEPPEPEGPEDPAEPGATGEDGEPSNGTFDSNNVDPSSTQSSGFAGVIDAPDLVYGEAFNSPIVEGILEFVALGDVAFEYGQLAPSVRVFNSNGLEIVDPSLVEIGFVEIVGGRVLVEVVHRDPDVAPGIAIVVHDVLVDVPDMREQHQIGYTATGTSTKTYSVSTAPLVHTDVPDSSVYVSLAWARVFDDEDGYLPIGEYPVVVRADAGEPIQGFVRGVVFAESEVRGIDEGSVDLRPLDTFQLVANESTAVYIVDADTNEDVSEAFENVELTTTSEGGTRITFEGRKTNARLKVVVANINIDFGVGPTAFGRNARLGIGGTALSNVMNRNVTLVVSAPRGEGEAKTGLRENPLDIFDWQPVAGFDE